MLTAVALLQNVWLARVSLFGARPDLVFLVVLVWTLQRGMYEGMTWGFIGGLVIDLLSGGPLGTHAMALLAVAYVGRQPWGEGLGVPVVRVLLLGLVSGLVYHVVLLTVLTWTGHEVDWSHAFLQVAAPSVALNTALTPLARQALGWASRRVKGKVPVR